MFLFKLSRESILTCFLMIQHLYYMYFILVLVGGLIAESIITIMPWQRIIRPERDRKTDENTYVSV